MDQKLKKQKCKANVSIFEDKDGSWLKAALVLTAASVFGSGGIYFACWFLQR